MTNLEIKLKYADGLCKQRKVRLTEKRRKVLYSLLKSDRAVSAYELIECLRLNFDEDFAPMTVYRILNFLEDQSLVHKLQSTNKYVVCANINESSIHKLPQFLICNSCEKVDEIYLDDRLIEAVRINIKKKGFYVSEPRFELKGLCENCHND